MQEPEQQQVIPPHPVPTLITVGQAEGTDGTRWVIVSFNTPTGVASYFLDPDAALKVAGEIRHNGRAAKSGLITPPNAGGLHVVGNA